MSPLAAVAVAIGVLALSGQGAAACGLWFCEQPVYPPMHVPADDQRVGPTWTRNGWVYPRTHGYGEPIPYADPGQGLYGLKDFDRPRAPWRDERPRHWRR